MSDDAALRNGTNIGELLEVMRRLRDPDSGCPWDLEQSYRSIVPHTLEEAYEVADAIERDAMDELPDELGDLLFQIVFYSQLGKEDARFDFDDVVAGVVAKLIRRHPHVFADDTVTDSAEQTLAWEQLKAAERDSRSEQGAATVLQGVSIALPALTRAAKLQRRAAKVGFDWPDHRGVLAKLEEEKQELQQAMAQESPARVEEELGDLLFTCVNLARHLQVDPESALRLANSRFEQRFGYMEDRLQAQDQDIHQTPVEELERLWQQSKGRVE